jgi:hypothetical protein
MFLYQPRPLGRMVSTAGACAVLPARAMSWAALVGEPLVLVRHASVRTGEGRSDIAIALHGDIGNQFMSCAGGVGVALNGFLPARLSETLWVWGAIERLELFDLRVPAPAHEADEGVPGVELAAGRADRVGLSRSLSSSTRPFQWGRWRAAGANAGGSQATSYAITQIVRNRSHDTQRAGDRVCESPNAGCWALWTYGHTRLGFCGAVARGFQRSRGPLPGEDDACSGSRLACAQ